MIFWHLLYCIFAEKGDQKRVHSAMESGSETEGAQTEKKGKKKTKSNSYYQPDDGESPVLMLFSMQFQSICTMASSCKCKQVVKCNFLSC